VQLNLDNTNGVFVRSFANGELHVNNEILNGPVILTLQDIIRDWTPPPIAELCMADFSAALELEPEVILFGTGATQVFPPATLFTGIMRTGVGFEVMDTAAACRTFNVLAAEGRRVIAALIV
jgi:uncharacterized protein